jgi:hypothetical protein
LHTAGETIELTAEVYRQIRQLLATRPRRRSRARINKVIHETYGKYAGGPSLTQALLTERAAERARDDAR